MTTTNPPPTKPPVPDSGLSRKTLTVLFLISLTAVGVVLYLVFRPDASTQEIILSSVEVDTPQAIDLNVMEVKDTLDNPDVQAREGYRYKVLITDLAREGASGITRIGGLVTFVPNVEVGEVVVIELTSIRRTTAHGVVLERIAREVDVPTTDAPTERRRERDTSPAVDALTMEGQIFRGTVEDTGRDGDGIVFVDGKVVFVEGSRLGEHVEFRVVEDMGRFARAIIVRVSDEPFEPVAEAAPAAAPSPDPTRRPRERELPVSLGDEYEVVITDQARRQPERDGITRIDGLVVIVEQAQPGQRVRIRITELMRSSALAEVIEVLNVDSD